MTRITIDVDDDRAQELIDYLNSLAYAKVAEDEIPEWQKEEVRRRIEAIEKREEELVPLEDALKRISEKL